MTPACNMHAEATAMSSKRLDDEALEINFFDVLH